jgi:16S rRNA (cytosine1402-N4)-methyltransferase
MTIHKPVLLEETIENLDLKKGDVVIDATLGGGGHSTVILEKIGKEGTLIALDLDREAVEKFAEFPISNFQFPNKSEIPIFKNQNIYLVNDSFANLESILAELKIEKVDAILADLGWSSDQLLNRGMSFRRDEKLDMRLRRDQDLSARTVVNDYSREDLERIIRDYGEERFARNIARKIVEARKEKEIETTHDLVEIIESAVPARYKHQKIPRKSRPDGTQGKHLATRTFQAIRIEVNGELDNLKKFIPKSIESLSEGGRLAIISFHSLEDRIVKDIFRENARGCICPRDFPQCVCGNVPDVRIVTKKPIVAKESEVLDNPRARSAKLRVCEKV